MTRAKDISKIVTDANLSGTLDVTGTVTAGGNLLVGTNTNAVYYNSVSTYNASAVIKTSTSNDVADLVLVNGDNNFGSTIDFARTNTSSNDVRFALIGGYVDSNTAGSESGNIRFSTKDTGDSNIVERMRIDSSGNVGIGSAATAYPLEVFDTNGNGIAYKDTTNSVTNFLGAYNSVGISGTLTNHPYAIWTNNAERMKIDSAGHVTMPNQPAFQARPSSVLTDIAINTAVNLNFANEIFDRNADYNAGGSPSTFTAPVTGVYQLNLNAYILNLDTASTYLQISIITSNRSYDLVIDPNFSSDLSYYHMTISVLADMDAGDTAYIQAYQSGGTAQTDISGGSTFSGYLVA